MRRFVVCLLVLIGIVVGFSVSIVRASDPFVPLLAENAEQVQPLVSLQTYSVSLRRDIHTLAFSDDSLVLLPLIERAKSLALDTLQVSELPSGYPVAVDAEGRRFVLNATLSSGNGSVLYDNATGSSVRLRSTNLQGAAFTPDGRYVLTHANNEYVGQLWDVKSGEEVALLDSDFGYGYRNERFSPDGREIVLLKKDRTVALWDITTQTERLTLFTGKAAGAVFTPDGNILITYSGINLMLWDTKTGEQLAAFQRDARYASYSRSVYISADATRMILTDGLPEVWDISDPRNPQSLGTMPAYTFLGFSPDGATLLASDNGRETLFLLDSTTLEVRAEVAEFERYAQNANFNAAGDLLITELTNSRIQLWGWDGTRLTQRATLLGNNFVLSPDSTSIAALIDPGHIVVYGIPTADRIAQPLLLPGVIIPSVINVRSAPSPQAEVIGRANSGTVTVAGRNGNFVYLTDYRGWVSADPTFIKLKLDFPITILPELQPEQVASIVLTATSTPNPTATRYLTSTPLPTLTPGAVPTLVLTNTAPETETSERTAITVGNLNEVTLLDVLPGVIEPLYYYGLPSLGGVSKDGAFFISAADDTQSARVWSLDDFTYLGGPSQSSYSLVSAASADGKYIAQLDEYKNEFQIWDVVARRIHGRETVQGRRVQHFSFSPDSRLLVATDDNGAAYIWDVESMALLGTPPDGRLAAVDPTGRTLVIAPPSRGSLIRFFDLEPLQERLRFDAGSIDATQLLFNTDGTRLLIKEPYRVLLWDAATGEQLTTYTEQDAKLTLSADGQFAVIGNRLINLVMGQQIATLDVGRNDGAAFSPDGKMLFLSAPLRAILLETGEVVDVPGNYTGRHIVVSPDGTSVLLQGDNKITMVLGIPSAQRPRWEPITAKVVTSGINLRAGADDDTEVIGYASGEVKIYGRANGHFAVYLADLGGWVWADSDYLAIDRETYQCLPILHTP